MQIRPCLPALQRKAEDELTETPSKIESSLKIIRDWLKKQPHLHSVEPTDQWLIAFLRGCKYDIEKCKGKLDKYYTIKRTMPEFFNNRDPFDEKIQEILKIGVLLPLKCMKEDSPRPTLIRLGPYSSSGQQYLKDFLKVCIMVVEVLLLEDDNFTIAGEVFSHSKDSLYEHIDKSILPKEYGGTDGSLQDLIDFWKTKVESYRDWFTDERATQTSPDDLQKGETTLDGFRKCSASFLLSGPVRGADL